MHEPSDELNAAPLRRLNLNLLYALDAILNARSLTEAGQRVLLTQPAMSASLRKLRDQFRDELVVYVGGVRRLTALAEMLRPRVRRVLVDLNDTFHLSLGFDPGTATKVFRISAPEAIEITLFGGFVKRLLRDAPGIQIHILPFDSANPVRGFDLGADMVVIPARLGDDRFPSEYLLNDNLACMVSLENPHLDTTLTPEMYLAERHVIVTGPQWSSAHLDGKARNLLSRRCGAVETPRHAALPGLIIGTNLIATGSAWLFQYYSSMMPIGLANLPFGTTTEPIIAQWPAHRSDDPAHQWLLNHLIDATRSFREAMPLLAR